MSKIRWIVAYLLALGLLAWAPWMPAEEAAARAERAFTSAWQGVADGCGFNCAGCGGKAAHRLPLGYSIEIEYACGLLPEDSPAYHKTSNLYVSPLGTVHGLPRP